MEVKCKATIYFYQDPFEKPEIILEGEWRGRDVVKAGALLQRSYRRHIRDLARGGKITEEAAIQAEEEITAPVAEEEE